VLVRASRLVGVLDLEATVEATALHRFGSHRTDRAARPSVLVMPLDIHGLMSRLAIERPIFHSEADFQHSLAWLIHTEHPSAQIRLETRPERGIRLDLLVLVDGERIAIELKYLVARFDGVVNGEHYALPNQAAQDISRHDFIKDICRVERFVAYGIGASGWAVALSNDGSYWRQGLKADPVDAMFRLHKGRVLEGSLTWGALAGSGTTRKRDEPLELGGSYRCDWKAYSSIQRASAKPSEFRYLAFCNSA
jgi:hypothetical protein